jgi:hypothetical protein
LQLTHARNDLPAICTKTISARTEPKEEEEEVEEEEEDEGGTL